MTATALAHSLAPVVELTTAPVLSAEELARARRVLTHRECAPEDAGYVRTRCVYDRAALPRYHQDDRGRASRHRGHHEWAPDGAYSNIAAWKGRQAFLAAAQVVAQLPHAVEILRRHEISAEMLSTYLRVRTGYVQHQSTGRRCIVRPKVLAGVLDVSVNTVHRAQRVARELGLEVVVWGGRMLTFEESTACRRRGSRQRGLSTEVAFTIPRPAQSAVDSVTPTSGRSSCPQNRTFQPSPTHGASADKADATPSRRQPRGPAWSLARQLRARLPWLATESPGRCVPTLSRFATAPTPWTAEHIVYALADDAFRRGIKHQLTAEQIVTRPAVVLAGLLRHVDEISDHPDLAWLPPLELVACGRPDCDGHGWITVDASTVAPCPDCPPALRGRHLDQDDDGQLDEWGEEPPF